MFDIRKYATHDRMFRSNLSEFLMKLTAVGMILALVIAIVLSNQPGLELKIAGRIIHLLSLCLCFSLLLLHFGKRFVWLIAAAALLFIVGYFGFRLFYLQSLYIFFALAGAIIAMRFLRITELTFWSITAISAVFMFLQVLGVGEWTQALTTHGIISETQSVPKEPLPTLFLTYFEVQANYLQGRPAGILHSNQFSSFFILAAMALTFSRPASSVPAWRDFILCAAGVLTLSKATALGLAFIVLYLMFQGSEGRKRAVKLVLMALACLAIYYALFPGMFEIFFFNYYTFLESVLVRLASILIEQFGFSEEVVSAYLNLILESSSRQGMWVPTIANEIMMSALDAAGGARGTLVSAVLAYASLVSFCIFSIGVACTLKPVIFGKIIEAVPDKPARLQAMNILILCATALAMNYSGLMIFWVILGFCLPERLLLLISPKSRA